MTTARWLTRYGPEGASSRYRAYQFDQPLERAGHRSTFEPLAAWRSSRRSTASGVVRRIRTLTGHVDADVVVVQKEPIMPPALWGVVRPALRRRRGPLIWDIDDAVWIGRPAAHRMASEMAQLADVVVAGNELLADWCERQGAHDVRMIPTCFDPKQPVSIDARPGDGPVRVVWVGSPATAERFRAELMRMPQLLRSDRVQLTCVGAPPFDVDAGRRPRFVDWSPESEHDELERADFGISLLPRDEYSDHKCGFKLVQYLAYGLIPIATESPVHASILGGVGHLVGADASGIGEATAALSNRPSSAARRTAFDRWRGQFSVREGALRWIDVLSEFSRG